VSISDTYSVTVYNKVSFTDDVSVSISDVYDVYVSHGEERVFIDTVSVSLSDVYDIQLSGSFAFSDLVAVTISDEYVVVVPPVEQEVANLVALVVLIILVVAISYVVSSTISAVVEHD